MADLHAALAALMEEPKILVIEEPSDSGGSYVAVEVEVVSVDDIRDLLADYEPTPSDQALRDLRAGVEALADEWDRYAAMTDESGKEGRSVATVRRTSAVRLMHLLASTAPATASEGEPCGKCEWDGYGPNGCEHATASEGVEGTTEPGRNSSASEGATETRDKGLADYLAKMDNAGGGIYTSDFRDGFRHALAMLAAYETPAEPDQIRPEVREAARMALSLRATGVTSSDAATDQPPGLQVTADAATPVTSSDGDRGLGEEERRSLGCQCTRLDDVWHHARLCPVPAVERIIAARVDEAVGAALIVGATRSQPESTERVEWETRREWQGCRCGHPGAGCCCTGVKVRTGRRRTITTYAPVVGPWERVEDTTGGDDRG